MGVELTLFMLRDLEIPSWNRIPVSLQHAFYAQAQEVADRTKQKLVDRARKLETLRHFVTTKQLPEDRRWKEWKVGVVDGSTSPSNSERLGGRYGAYSAGYLVFQGLKPVTEEYSCGTVTHEQLGDPEISNRVASLLRTKLEREMAIQCMRDNDPDYIILDGSFFGFRVDAYVIQNEEIASDVYPTGADLTRDVTRLSRELLASGKAFGIIKRTRRAALDGWLTYHFKSERECVGGNDKHILSALIHAGHWFAYEWLFGNPSNFLLFAAFRKLFREYSVKGVHDVNTVFQKAVEETNNRNLILGDPMIPFNTKRCFVRPCQAMPFEMDAPQGVDIMPLLAYFNHFHNPATGLPFPIDLVDEYVTLPSGFIREFVEEVEARLIKDPDLSKRLEGIGLQDYFTYLNPQKPED